MGLSEGLALSATVVARVTESGVEPPSAAGAWRGGLASPAGVDINGYPRPRRRYVFTIVFAIRILAAWLSAMRASGSVGAALRCFLPGASTTPPLRPLFPSRRPDGRFLLRGLRRAARELLKQVRRAVTHTSDLLVQCLAVHPAFGLRLNGPGDPSELLGKRHHSLLHGVGRRRPGRVGRRRAAFRSFFRYRASPCGLPFLRCSVATRDRWAGHMHAPRRERRMGPGLDGPDVMVSSVPRGRSSSSRPWTMTVRDFFSS